jgi:hypothetical protein
MDHEVSRDGGKEGDLAVDEGDDAVVGDGDPVRVAAEIAEDVLGAAKGRLGVDDPLLGVELLLEGLPGQRMGELGRGACEVELALAICLVQRVDSRAVARRRPPWTANPWRLSAARSSSVMARVRAEDACCWNR